MLLGSKQLKNDPVNVPPAAHMRCGSQIIERNTRERTEVRCTVDVSWNTSAHHTPCKCIRKAIAISDAGRAGLSM